MNPLERAIAHCGNSQAEFARRVTLALGRPVRQQNVWAWLNKQAGVLPSEYVIAAAAAVDYKVTPHRFRPDIYPNPDDGLPPERRGGKRR